MVVLGIFSGRISGNQFRSTRCLSADWCSAGLFLTGMATIPMLYICHGVIAGMKQHARNPTLTTAQRWF